MVLRTRNDPGDPNCLHCKVSDLIFAIEDRGPEVVAYVTAMLCQNLGEFIAANAPPGALEEWTASAKERFDHEVKKAAADFRAAGKRRDN